MQETRAYLIRPEDGPEWIPIHARDLARVLTPDGWEACLVDGWGDHRIRVRDVDVSFSAEDVGWQVSIEGDLPANVADDLVDVVTRQITAHAGLSAVWVLLSE
ncbi:hypothetical protein [Microbispora sp. NBRC 16548]|uniref:hypothetical protein n=1 Tax=Microbispora sp. NBRC 16548 TaxID=3030994 RepID=UPI00160F0C0D|nr:hypothetical protein [Microbispora sp. NBRC 16548]